MRIVQIIDSLETGGAERMAVNFANALAKNSAFSGLVATRAEGSLRNQIDPDVHYLYLQRKRTLDLGAIRRLAAYCRENQVEFIQAHSSSYFIATMVKLLVPGVKVVWHDHNGMSEFLRSRESVVLKSASYFFSGIVVVNHQLKEWAIRELNSRHVIYLANFTSRDSEEVPQTVLLGESGKRILCLANLREQKNHFMLIEVAKMMKESHHDWTFHLVGKDFNDGYSAQVLDAIIAGDLEKHVFVYGTREDTGAIIRQSDIAILTSKSEGLPVALLEFGLYKRPVVVTSVGEIPLIVQNGENGFIVPPDDAAEFYRSLLRLIENPELRSEMGTALQSTIRLKNSEDAVMTKYLDWLQTISDV